MIDRDEFSAWLRLLETPGVGRESARALLARFGSPEAALAAPTGARKEVVGSAVAGALSRVPDQFAARRDAGWQWLADGDEPRDAIVVGDPRYPQLLLDAADPPLLLYVRGRIELLQAPAVAVVGSRNPTPQGLDNARAFSAHLSQAGWVVVSGLAFGVDAAAHEAALAGGTGTIAVVGTGLDVVYPGRHRALTARIAAEGLVVSEFAIGTPALPENFPIRNRIIAGLARGTLVVEARDVAEVWVDGVSTGLTTPTLGFHVKVGEHMVELRTPSGERSLPRTVKVTRGQTLRVALALPAPPPGRSQP